MSTLGHNRASNDNLFIHFELLPSVRGVARDRFKEGNPLKLKTTSVERGVSAWVSRTALFHILHFSMRGIRTV